MQVSNYKNGDALCWQVCHFCPSRVCVHGRVYSLKFLRCARKWCFCDWQWGVFLFWCMSRLNNADGSWMNMDMGHYLNNCCESKAEERARRSRLIYIFPKANPTCPVLWSKPGPLRWALRSRTLSSRAVSINFSLYSSIWNGRFLVPSYPLPCLMYVCVYVCVCCMCFYARMFTRSFE